jgi:hypothetical protein
VLKRVLNNVNKTQFFEQSYTKKDGVAKNVLPLHSKSDVKKNVSTEAEDLEISELYRIFAI